jgi:hypothetical protein
MIQAVRSRMSAVTRMLLCCAKGTLEKRRRRRKRTDSHRIKLRPPRPPQHLRSLMNPFVPRIITIRAGRLTPTARVEVAPEERRAPSAVKGEGQRKGKGTNRQRSRRPRQTTSPPTSDRSNPFPHDALRPHSQSALRGVCRSSYSWHWNEAVWARRGCGRRRGRRRLGRTRRLSCSR